MAAREYMKNVFSLPGLAGFSLLLAVILQGASRGMPDGKGNDVNQNKLNLDIAAQFFREFALATGVVLCVKHGLTKDGATVPAAVIATILVLIFFNMTDNVTILNVAKN